MRAKAAIVAVLVASGLLASSPYAEPVLAQARAVLMMRDVDTPALTPFRASLDFPVEFINEQRLVTTVPAGKRLVLQHISYWTYSVDANQFVFGSLRNGELGPNALLLQVNPPHASATPGLSIQDGSMPVTVYFESGEEVWLSVSKNTGAFRQFNAQIYGHLITP